MSTESPISGKHGFEEVIAQLMRGECDLEATLIPEMREPFDVFAEGLDFENSRDDRMAIELFVAEIGRMADSIRVHLCQSVKA